MTTDILFLFAMGAVAGILAGLLGIGGGLIFVPVLVIVFTAQGVSIDVLMHVAIGTSLATIVVTSISSIRAHHKRSAIDWLAVKKITIGVLLGGLAGAVIAKVIPGEKLKILFAIFLLLVALRMYFDSPAPAQRTLPGYAGMIAAGTVIGTISSLMGVGGGTMTVPFLSWCNMNIRKAVATSAAVGFPIALAGTVGFIITGWSVAERPAMSIGYVNLPAFFSIVIASALSAPLGAWIAHRIDPRLLKRMFAVFLFLLSLRIFLS